MAASTVSSWAPPSLPEPAAASGLVLLDRWCYIADLPNTTTAESTTSSGLPIKVTFRAARPPLLSHFCVHCPGLDFRRITPKIVATDTDLVLLRVPLDPNSTFISGLDWDYFVYRPRTQWLDLLPNPDPRWFNDSATALINPRKSQVIRDCWNWKFTAWNMAIPVGSWEGWRRDCAVDVRDVNLKASDPCLSDLMAMLSSKATRRFKELPVAYPILSMDDDVVYLLSRTTPRHMDKLAVMFAILRGLAELDAQKSTIFLADFFASEICRGV